MQPYGFRAPLQLNVPVRLELDPAIMREHPDSSLLPNPRRAEAAGTRTLHLLERLEDSPLATGHAKQPERMPHLNILGWSVPKDRAGV